MPSAAHQPTAAAAEEDLSPVPAPAELLAWARLQRPSALISRGIELADLSRSLPKAFGDQMLGEALDALELSALKGELAAERAVELAMLASGELVWSLPLRDQAKAQAKLGSLRSTQRDGQTLYVTESGERACLLTSAMEPGATHAPKPRLLCGNPAPLLAHLPYLRRTLSVQKSQGDLYFVSERAEAIERMLGWLTQNLEVSVQPSAWLQIAAQELPRWARDTGRLEFSASLEQQLDAQLSVDYKKQDHPLTRLLLQRKDAAKKPQFVAENALHLSSFAALDETHWQEFTHAAQQALVQQLGLDAESAQHAEALADLLLFSQLLSPTGYAHASGLVLQDLARTRDELALQLHQKGEISQSQYNQLIAALQSWRSHASARSVEQQMEQLVSLPARLSAKKLQQNEKRLRALQKREQDPVRAQQLTSQAQLFASLAKLAQGMKFRRIALKPALGLPQGSVQLALSVPQLGESPLLGKLSPQQLLIVPVEGGSLLLSAATQSELVLRAKQALAGAGAGAPLARTLQPEGDSFALTALSASSVIVSLLREQISEDGTLPSKTLLNVLSSDEARSGLALLHVRSQARGHGGEHRVMLSVSPAFVKSVLAAVLAGALD